MVLHHLFPSANTIPTLYPCIDCWEAISMLLQQGVWSSELWGFITFVLFCTQAELRHWNTAFLTTTSWNITCMLVLPFCVYYTQKFVKSTFEVSVVFGWKSWSQRFSLRQYEFKVNYMFSLEWNNAFEHPIARRYIWSSYDSRWKEWDPLGNRSQSSVIIVPWDIYPGPGTGSL